MSLPFAVCRFAASSTAFQISRFATLGEAGSAAAAARDAQCVIVLDADQRNVTSAALDAASAAPLLSPAPAAFAALA